MAVILSVGIDIGTSTTQIVFSRITMDNMASYFSAPRISITEKEIVYKSPVYFTPLLTDVLIDADKVKDIAAFEYAKAGYTPEDIDTGAVIITGESARKENAQAVLKKLSSFAGEFVVSTAGPDLESIIAGKGSGAYSYSLEKGVPVINLDIGGGTTNIVQFDDGDVVGKACFDIGGRLIRIKQEKVSYISDSAREIAAAVGVNLAVGDRVDVRKLQRITDQMARVLAQAIGIGSRFEGADLAEKVKTHGSSDLREGFFPEKICFSGGVADCIYTAAEEDLFKYEDIGPLLGKSIRESGLFNRSRLLDASETIRATVVGAGIYTTSLSGSTISYSEGMFPVKNLPVLKLTAEEQEALIINREEVLREKVSWFLEQSDSSSLVLAMEGPRNPTYKELTILGNVIMRVMDSLSAPGEPVIVVTEQDIAKALGVVMQQYGAARKTASIDSIRVEENDYIDIGRPLMNGLIVPVVVKTLLFG